MNVLDLLTKSYSALHNYPGIPFWVLTPFRRIVRNAANMILPAYLARPKEHKQASKKDLIVSFTSFPTRINNVWQVVECMLRQTNQPNKIILWLSKDQFPTAESIPQSLRDREGDIFEIRMVDGDIRSHKKYYYVSKEYPDALIFLIDDDIYYPTDILEKTIKARESNPDAVICNYGYHIGYNDDGSLKPYNKWVSLYSQSQDSNIFFGSGGGTLFRPCELHKDLTDIETARNLTPIADDIWLNAMVRLVNKPIFMLKNGLILPIKIKDNKRLASLNKGQDMNDIQIKAINDYYKNEDDFYIF